MYCRNCGQELNDNDRVCPACGTPVEKSTAANEEQKSGYYREPAEGAPHVGAQTYSYGGNTKSAGKASYQYSGPEYQDSYDSGSAGWGFLGCCFPLIGLILFLVWKDEKPKSAKSAGVGAIIGVVLVVVLIALLFALGIGLSALGIAAGVAEGEIDLSELEEYLEQNTSTIINNLNL